MKLYTKPIVQIIGVNNSEVICCSTCSPYWRCSNNTSATNPSGYWDSCGGWGNDQGEEGGATGGNNAAQYRTALWN